jgi:hypothetical protein
VHEHAARAVAVLRRSATDVDAARGMWPQRAKDDDLKVVETRDKEWALRAASVAAERARRLFLDAEDDMGAARGNCGR